MKKLYIILWICLFICLASVSSARKWGSKQKKGKRVYFISNAFFDKIIINNILGLGFNGSMIQTLLRMNNLVISSDNGRIFKSDAFRKSQMWFTDVETGYNEMRQDVRQLKKSFSSLSTQIKNLEAVQMKMFSTMQEAIREILKQLNAPNMKSDCQTTLIPTKSTADTLVTTKLNPSTILPTTLPTTIQSTTLSYCQDFNANFTTLGATGRLGPKTLGSHYANKSQDGMVRLDKGIQMFTVPCTGKYRISVAGAAGAYSKGNPIEFRGRGAWLAGVFHLTIGSILKILVGQVGGYNEKDSTGGGGGTFITDINNKPIIIAGGGGGTDQRSNSRHWQCNGTTNTTGNPSYGGKYKYQGGRDGQGATDGPSGATNRFTGGGGGGLLSDGKDGSVWGSYTPPSGGKAFVHGGEGGAGGQFNPRATGGFGGGGGSYAHFGGGGGGGGGYSGGAKGDNKGKCAGGGGSYNTGSHQQGKDGDNDGEGYALITWIE